MIRHPLLWRLHAAASSGSIIGWTPAGIDAPQPAQPAQDEPEPPRQDWMYDHDWDRFLRHWREKRGEVAN